MKEKPTDDYVVVAGSMLLFFGCGTLFYQLYIWLKTGAWGSLPLSTGLKFIGIDDPRTGWSESQKTVDWLLATPLCLWFIMIGVCIMIIGQMMRAVKVSR